MGSRGAAADGRVVWAIDLGGTNTKVGLVAADGRIVARGVLATRHERGGDAWCDEVVSALREAAGRCGVSEDAVEAMGVGAPGPLNAKEGVLTNPMPNLPGWQGYPICAALRARTGKPVFLDNDANCAGLAEHWAGAGRGVSDLIVLTLGTGIGSGVVAGGRLLHGAGGNAGELGHISINFRGPRCACGSRGCIELYACSSAVTSRYRRKLRKAGRPLTGSAAITAEGVFAAAEAGDEAAQETYREVGERLGMAIASMVHAFNPEMVVLAGGMAGAAKLLLGPVRRVVRERTYPEHHTGLRIEASELGEMAGLLGAARLALVAGQEGAAG